MLNVNYAWLPLSSAVELLPDQKWSSLQQREDGLQLYGLLNILEHIWYEFSAAAGSSSLQRLLQCPPWCPAEWGRMRDLTWFHGGRCAGEAQSGHEFLTSYTGKEESILRAYWFNIVTQQSSMLQHWCIIRHKLLLFLKLLKRISCLLNTVVSWIYIIQGNNLCRLFRLNLCVAFRLGIWFWFFFCTGG